MKLINIFCGIPESGKSKFALDVLFNVSGSVMMSGEEFRYFNPFMFGKLDHTTRTLVIEDVPGNLLNTIISMFAGANAMRIEKRGSVPFDITMPSIIIITNDIGTINEALLSHVQLIYFINNKN